MSAHEEPPINPYAAPEASLDAAPPVPSAGAHLFEMEATRRTYIGHEASVKSVGTLHILGAVLVGVFSMMILLAPENPGRHAAEIAVVVGMYALVAGVNVGIGIGLTKLQNWARWVDAAFVAIGILAGVSSTVLMLSFARGGLVFVPSLIANGVFLLIYGYILYLFVSPKASVVFSPDYKQVVKATPHIKYKTSCLVKAIAALFFIGVVFAIVRSIFGTF